MRDKETLPILNHPLDEPSAFTASALMQSVRRARNVPSGPLPPLCILDFDGDLTDWLIQTGRAVSVPGWPCFHTTMYALDMEGITCGIIARTIGGPYAVLIAEQLAAAGVEWIIGLTSAGRISPELPLPCLVVATAAIRDEGTSLHYLPPGREVGCPEPMPSLLARELSATDWAVRSGTVWTTDAPYRETRTQLQRWADEGVLAVEMQAASLFAFGNAQGVAVGCVAMVSNAVDHEGEQFDTGAQEDGLRILSCCVRAFRNKPTGL
jgi:uridine phosphorylase